MVCVKRKTLIVCFVALAFVVALLSGMIFFGGNSAVSATESEKISELSDIVVKIGNYGYQIEQKPVEIEQITVPEDFNEVYEKHKQGRKKIVQKSCRQRKDKKRRS